MHPDEPLPAFPLHVHPSRRSFWIGVVGGGALAAVFLLGSALGLATSTGLEDPTKGVLGILAGLFLVSLFVSFARRLRHDPMYTLDETELVDHTVGGLRIRWKDVAEVGLLHGQHGGAAIVVLGLKGAAHKLAWWRIWLLPNLGIGGPIFRGRACEAHVVNFAGTSLGRARLAALFLRLITGANPHVHIRRNLLWQLFGIRGPV